MSRMGPLVLVLALALCPSTAAASTDDQIHWTLINPTEVAFDWCGTYPFLFYGTVPGVYPRLAIAYEPQPLPFGEGAFFEARLPGLLPNQRYYYRIGFGEEHTFHSALPRGSSGFWFAEQGDIGSTLTYRSVGATQDSIARDEVNVPGDDRPEFVLMMGDLTYGDQDGLAAVKQHFNDVMPWSQSAAYMPAWGNHEWDPAGSSKPDQVKSYKGRFHLPNSRRSPGTGAGCVQDDTVPGKDWYWFDYGNVRFISIPPASEGACGFVGARLAWRLAADSLMASVDADPQIKFIVTFGHHPAYSSGADHVGDPNMAADLAKLRAKHEKYVLNISAHSHHYERFDPAMTGGLLHVVAAGGGSTLGGLGSPAPETVVRYNHLEHLKIRVSADRIDGFCVCGPSRSEETYLCEPGTILDMWSITSNDLSGVPPGGPALPVRAGWYDVQGRRMEPGAAGAYFRPGKPRVVVR